MKLSARLIMLSLLLGTSLTVFAQRGEQQRNVPSNNNSSSSNNSSSYKIEYKYLYDDPYAFRKFKIHLDILGLDWTAGNFPIHGGLQINYSPHPRINFEVLGRVAYYDFRFFAAKKNDDKMSDNKLLPFMYGEALIEWNAMDKERRRNLKFNLTQLTVNYYWQYTEYAYIPITYRRFFSFRGGANYYMMPVEGTSKTPLTDKTTGTTYESDYYTMAKALSFFGGISWGRKARTAIRITDYGIRRVVQQNQFMVDVIYCFPDIGNLDVLGTERVLTMAKPRNLGWRIGWQWNNYNMHQRFEFGQRPSYDKSNFFLMYTLGFTIIGREKG
jgi:hypothetical protein